MLTQSVLTEATHLPSLSFFFFNQLPVDANQPLFHLALGSTMSLLF